MAVEDFARELRLYIAEHGTPTGQAISKASERLAQQARSGKPTDKTGVYVSAPRVSETLKAKGKKPPSAAVVFSIIRAVRHLQYPTEKPITFEHPDVTELLELRCKAIERQELGIFRERRLRAALQNRKVLGAQHGCFALHALDGSTLYIGSAGKAPETLATRIKATLGPDNPTVDREHVAELEVWPLPDLAIAPDLEAVVARLEDTLILRALYATAPATLRLMHDDSLDDAAIPQSRLFPLVDHGTLLAVREAINIHSTDFAHRSNAHFARTEALYRRRPS